MKTQFKTVVNCFAFAGMLLFTNCHNDAVNEKESNLSISENVDTAIPKDLERIKWGNIVLPAGTMSNVSEDGSSLTFELPKGYVYVAYAKSGQSFFATTGGYTCSGGCNPGCDVVKFGSEVGCTACKDETICSGSRTPTASLFKSNLSEKEHFVGEGENGVLVNLNEGVNFINADAKKSHAETHDSVSFDAVIAIPQAQQELDRFVKKYWGNSDVDIDNADLVLVNFYGSTISLYIPKIQTKNLSLSISDGSESCKCNSGSSGCKLEDVKKGYITVGKKCAKGSCTSCTMSW